MKSRRDRTCLHVSELSDGHDFDLNSASSLTETANSRPSRRRRPAPLSGSSTDIFHIGAQLLSGCVQSSLSSRPPPPADAEGLFKYSLRNYDNDNVRRALVQYKQILLRRSTSQEFRPPTRSRSGQLQQPAAQTPRSLRKVKLQLPLKGHSAGTRADRKGAGGQIKPGKTRGSDRVGDSPSLGRRSRSVGRGGSDFASKVVTSAGDFSDQSERYEQFYSSRSPRGDADSNRNTNADEEPSLDDRKEPVSYHQRKRVINSPTSPDSQIYLDTVSDLGMADDEQQAAPLEDEVKTVGESADPPATVAPVDPPATAAIEETPPAAPEVAPQKDPLAETEQMVKHASQEMDRIEAESKFIAAPVPEVSSEAKNDMAVVKEVEECETQCMEIYGILNELKQRVGELMNKPVRTEEEDRELEEKQQLLNEKMTLLEEKTRKLEKLIGRSKIGTAAEFNKDHSEDILPKVIICGFSENHTPNLIVCDDHRVKRRPVTGSDRPSSQPCTPAMPQYAKKLSESYCMQEKLAKENADLEGKRYQLQEDLLNKDQTVECLQRRICSLQTEMRMVCKENSLLSEKLQKVQTVPCSQGDVPKVKRMPCGKEKGPCPSDIEGKLNEYTETTQHLEKQLTEMESEVRNMQSEIMQVRQERLHLEQHRRMMCPPPPCMQPPCVPRPPPGIECQLRELREQYNTLQDDYKGKVIEVAGLRADVEKLKVNAKEAEESKRALEGKNKEMDKMLKEFKLQENKLIGSKEALMEQEQQLVVAKQRYREVKDELEEVRALVEDQQSQLEDYRNKYLQAQQQVEEQRRQIDLMELENNRIAEQVNLEIQRVKNQFQEKLQELTPLPDILKATQLKLQEAQQMHLLAERNNEGLVHELQAYRDKAAAIANEMENARSDQMMAADERQALTQRCEDFERRCRELEDDNNKLHLSMMQLEETTDEAERKLNEKLHEIAQLQAELENVREESARQVSRTKDRCETVRRSMQQQISDLERQLAQSRAQARAAQKDRDEIRQKMQSQINNLNENFEDAQMRIRNLQGHVNFLKNSYTTVFPDGTPNSTAGDGLDPCGCSTPGGY